MFGSGPLLVRGIIDEVGDLDVVCRGVAWDRARELGEVHRLEPYGVEVVALDEGRITFGMEWGIGAFDVNELIDTAELIDGIPFVRLEHVVAYKRIAARAKDVAHLAALDRWRAAPQR